MKLSVARFKKEDTLQWNEFLRTTRNGLFLFHRSYIEYHADRFSDHSLLIFRSGKIIAIFPANEKENIIYSHGGLTFGGLVFSKDLRTNEAMLIFNGIIEYYKGVGVKEIYYKAIPYIFSSYPCQEDLYALFRHNAILYRRDISSAIDLAAPIRFSESKRQSLTKCEQAGVKILENTDFSQYWELLTSVLKKFEVSPVHSLEEINLLKQRFEGKIRLFEARLGDELLAGIIIYDYDRVVHTQYMANSINGRAIGALDYINGTLITGEFKDRRYYSFGISTEQDGRFLNEGLIQQKEMMGGRAIVNDFYKILL